MPEKLNGRDAAASSFIVATYWSIVHPSSVPPRTIAPEAAQLRSQLGQPGAKACSPQIQDYGVIGDCRSAALISLMGSIDWLCWPRFEKPSIFAAILDRDRGGYWLISPAAEATIGRQYVRDTNVLETRFSTQSGEAVLTDLMPGATSGYYKNDFLPDHEIIRRVCCTQGEIEIKIDFRPAPNYGEDRANLWERGKLGIRFEVGKGVYWLRSSAALKINDERTSAYARITMRKGDVLRFSFTYAEEAPAVLRPLEQDVDARIDHAVEGWQRWAIRADYDGEHRSAVVRSALALKLLTYLPSGAIIAAPTTSLPERIGDSLNWDYRYCWLRDSSLTIRALLELGYWDEAEDFLDWMLQATRLTQPRLRILYSLYGGEPPVERELRHLAGYCGSRPVRIGNAARNQLQLDVYGEVIDAAAQFAFHGGHLDSDMQGILISFGNYVVENWNQADEGIWEPRCGRQHHTHSRLLCWTALDRLIRLCKKGILQKAPVDTYEEHCNAIRRQIEHHAWNERIQSYVSVLDGDELDASSLLISWYGFDEAGSPRMRGTYNALRRQLGTSNGLLYRYARTEPEGAFALCSFWEAEYLALGGGTLHEAKQLFTHLVKFGNDLGLFAEEIDPATGAALGNFPQAFTHIGLISAALSINQREKGEQQLAHRPPNATYGASSEVHS